MTHFWLRAEVRANERRTPLLPEGAAHLIAAGNRVTVEDSRHRIIPTAAYAAAGCTIAATASWESAPTDAVILGLKELPEATTPLRHRHIFFGHAFKGQPDGPALLARFAAGGGALFDLEYLTDDAGRRLTAFGIWAGFAGAAMALATWAAQADGTLIGPVSDYDSRAAMIADVAARLAGRAPSCLIIGALGRTGRGARDACEALGLTPTGWDMAETARGGPFPEVLAHAVFLNCILAGPGTPVFVPADTPENPQRALRVVGDIACDPGSDYNPVPIYDAPTGWNAPAIRVATTPPLDVMAIDNLPSLLPQEASEAFAADLLALLLAYDADPDGVWARAGNIFAAKSARA
jgi:saccharopine dehydrogenase (NAD+, L-lysine-forming)